jgi:hypothetical protein
MGPKRSLLVLALSLLAPAASLGAQSAPAAAGPAATDSEAARPRKSVRGTLESVDANQRGVIMKSDAGARMTWRFDAAVVAEVAKHKPGDPMIVIYRQISSNEKRVTAVAFPGTAQTPVYVNMTGSRVLLRSAPGDAECTQPDLEAASETTISPGGAGEAMGTCWCCTAADKTCTPRTKTGHGRALLVSCFE